MPRNRLGDKDCIATVVAVAVSQIGSLKNKVERYVGLLFPALNLQSLMLYCICVAMGHCPSAPSHLGTGTPHKSPDKDLVRLAQIACESYYYKIIRMDRCVVAAL